MADSMQLDLDLYRRDVLVSANPRVNLSVIDVDPGQSEGTIVFVHGYGGNATQWHYQLNTYASTHRVVAVDLRGHGQSSRPASAYTLDEFVDDLTRTIELLEIRQPFTLAGHSYGGAIAAAYAVARPHQVERLILIATASKFELIAVAELAFRLPVTVLNLARPFLRRAFSAPPAVLKRCYYNGLSQWRGETYYPHIQTPTLVIMGDRDRVFPKAVFEDVPRLIPNAQAVNVGVSAHMVMLERREAVNRAINRFLGGTDTWRSRSLSAPSLQRQPWLQNYEPGIPPLIAVPKRPLHSFLESAARRFGNHTALVFQGRRLTYRELNHAADQFATALRARGVRKGERVMLLLPNLPQFVIAYFGILKAGAIVVLANPIFDEDALVHQIIDAQTETLITLSLFYPLVRRVRRQRSLERVILANVKDYLPPVKRWAFTLFREQEEGHRVDAENEPGLMGWDEFMALGRDSYIDAGVQLDDLAVIQYTGGTTDLPKGVMMTHRNLVANAVQVRHWLTDVREGKEVFLGVLPFSHSYGMTACMNVGISVAGTLILLPTFVTREVLETIKKYTPTLFPGVPTMYTAINDHPGVRKYGLSSIRACISGAAPLPLEVQEAFEKLTKGRLVEGYGLTEAGPVTHANPLQGRRVAGSIGVPLPSTEARIIDWMTGQFLPAGQIGELVVRGPQVMQGYWNRPSETAQAFLPDPAGGERWLRTGDIAEMDADGYFRIIDRKKDMILAGSYNVYPRDIEEVLYEHPKVREVAVVGVPYGAQDGTVPMEVKAVIVPRQGVSITKEELLALCKARLEEWAVPEHIEFRAELPKSLVGKVLRRMLAESEPPKLDGPGDDG